MRTSIANFTCLLLLSAAPAAAQTPPVKAGGYVQVRETYQQPTKLSATLNRVRLSAESSLPHRFSWRMLVEYEAPAGVANQAIVSLRDAYINWAYGTGPLAGTVRAGQFKTPFSRDYITSIAVTETADRPAVVDTLAPKRDIGVMVESAMTSYATVSLGVFNSEGQNAILNRDTTVLVVSRGVVRPLPQLTLAGNVAYHGTRSSRYGAEVHIEEQGILVRSELIGVLRPGAAQDDQGWYVLLGYRALPWLQLIARQEDFLRPALGVSRRISAFTGGANVEIPGGKTRIVLNGVRRTTGFPRVARNSAIAQLQVRF